jgi:hypothetical protein
MEYDSSKNELLRILCRLAWNNWPDTDVSRREIAAHEARDQISAQAWDRVINVILKSAPTLDASQNTAESLPIDKADVGADTITK